LKEETYCVGTQVEEAEGGASWASSLVDSSSKTTIATTSKLLSPSGKAHQELKDFIK
jgi:hypothetical protein